MIGVLTTSPIGRGRRVAPGEGVRTTIDLNPSPEFVATLQIRPLPMGEVREVALQSSNLVSSGACGGGLIAIAFYGRPSGLVPPCGGPLGIITRSPGFTRTSLLPSLMVPGSSTIYCSSYELRCACLC